MHLPFSIYLGWVSVATIANVTSTLDYLKWGGWGIAPELWAVIMLIAGVGIALAMSLTRGDAPYVVVLIWAYVGIAVKQSGAPLVATAAGVAAGLLVCLLAVSVSRSRQRKRYGGL